MKKLLNITTMLLMLLTATSCQSDKENDSANPFLGEWFYQEEMAMPDASTTTVIYKLTFYDDRTLISEVYNDIEPPCLPKFFKQAFLEYTYTDEKLIIREGSASVSGEYRLGDTLLRLYAFPLLPHEPIVIARTVSQLQP